MVKNVNVLSNAGDSQFHITSLLGHPEVLKTFPLLKSDGGLQPPLVKAEKRMLYSAHASHRGTSRE